MRSVLSGVSTAALALASGLLLGPVPPLQPGAAQAGEASAQSSLGQEDAIQQALERMPAGNAMTNYRCEDLVQPLISSLYRCTVEWGPLPR